MRAAPLCCRSDLPSSDCLAPPCAAPRSPASRLRLPAPRPPSPCKTAAAPTPSKRLCRGAPGPLPPPCRTAPCARTHAHTPNARTRARARALRARVGPPASTLRRHALTVLSRCTPSPPGSALEACRVTVRSTWPVIKQTALTPQRQPPHRPACRARATAQRTLSPLRGGAGTARHDRDVRAATRPPWASMSPLCLDALALVTQLHPAVTPGYTVAIARPGPLPTPIPGPPSQQPPLTPTHTTHAIHTHRARRRPNPQLPSGLPDRQTALPPAKTNACRHPPTHVHTHIHSPPQPWLTQLNAGTCSCARSRPMHAPRCCVGCV